MQPIVGSSEIWSILSFKSKEKGKFRWAFPVSARNPAGQLSCRQNILFTMLQGKYCQLSCSLNRFPNVNDKVWYTLVIILQLCLVRRGQLFYQQNMTHVVVQNASIFYYYWLRVKMRASLQRVQEWSLDLALQFDHFYRRFFILARSLFIWG